MDRSGLASVTIKVSEIYAPCDRPMVGRSNWVLRSELGTQRGICPFPRIECRHAR